MPVDVLTGLVATNDGLANELVVDMSEDIAMLHATSDQFTTLLMKLPKRQAKREQVNWMEDQLFPRYTTCAVSATSAATTVDVAAGTGVYFRAGDVVKDQLSGEAFTVTSIATDALTIANRGLGGTTAASILVSDGLLIVNNAAAQGATMGTAKITKKVLGFNYTQIVRHNFRFTKTDLWVDRYGPDEPGREAAKKLTEHKRSIEYSGFFGARDFLTGGAEPVGYSGGMDEYIATNVHAAIGALTNTLIDGFLLSDIQNAESPALFVAPVIQGAISNMLRSIWHPPSNDENVYGAKVDWWLSGAYGSRVPVFVKRDWNDFPKTSNQYGGRGYIVDLANVALRPAPNVMGQPRFAALLKDRQANDADEFAAEYLSEYSMEVRQESKHARWSGVTS